MPYRHRRSASPVRRVRNWATTDQSVTIPVGQTSNTDLLAPMEIAGSSIVGVTVVRTIVRITWTAATLGDGFRFGLLVARFEDVGLNVPGQVTAADPDLDWLFLDRVYVDTQGAGAGVNTTFEYNVDTKAKRRCQKLGQTYILSLVNANAVSSTQQRIFARTLVLLP